jgi:hypothetical protein
MTQILYCSNVCNQIGGRLAQLVEQLIYTEKVRGSSPLSPTNIRNFCSTKVSFCFVRAIRDSKAGDGTQDEEE